MQTGVEQIGDVTVVSINEEQLDAGNADDFRQDIAPVIRDSKRLVIDLARVRFVDSRGCGAILSCLKLVSGNGGDLKLCNVSTYVRTVFDLIRLHRICEILPTKADAVRAFQQG
jgi:anti-sigma B factor antagonist